MKQELLDELSKGSTEEFYTPIPDGYRVGKTKFVIITGSVISGIGKGIFTASLGKLLVDRKVNVAPIKVEAYLNIDAGTLSPFRHGEVFVLDDGTETDMDLGGYERFLDKTLCVDNFTTSGRIYSHILAREREGKYLGRDVQFIPHVTGETKLILRNLAVKSKADIVLVEIGGTVGDYENMFAMEAIRELIYEDGAENVCVVNLTYVLEPSSLGEFKSKAAQLGIKRMIELGIQPNVIVCRSERPIPEKIKEKISMNVNVPVNRVFGAHDVENIYEVPLFMRETGVDSAILDFLGWGKKYPSNGNTGLKDWTKKNRIASSEEFTVAIAGKYTGLADSYISVLKALEHSSALVNAKINVKWIEATDIEKKKISVAEAMKGVSGLIVPGGFGGRGVEGKIECIRFARENRVPYLGLCFGLQMAVIEFARNVCGFLEANSTEIDLRTPNPVICILPEQDEIESLGATMRLGGFDVLVKKGTLAFSLYGKETIRERFRHRFNVNVKFIDALEKKGMVFSGRAPQKKIMQIMELPSHPYFIGSQYHPEFTSRPLAPNPLYLGFAKAAQKFFWESKK